MADPQNPPPPPDGSGIVAQSGAIPPPPDGSGVVENFGGTKETDSSLWGKIKAALAPRQVPTASTEQILKSPAPGSTEGHGMLEGLSDYDKASGGEIGGGVHDIAKGDVAKGLHRMISGFMAATTPLTPLVAPAMVAAPVATGLGIVGGIGGQKIAHAGAQALGATPDQADLAGDLGGLAGGVGASQLPGVAGKAMLLGKTPPEAYQSALKPSTTIPSARVANMVQTGLENEIPVSKAGVEKLGSLIDDLDDKVAAEIKSRPGRTVDPNAVATRADQIKGKFANQVNPTADLQAIDASKQEFLANNQGPMAAEDAQAMKQGTYAQLKGKAYGEMKTASIEAQKALARGLKEELENQFPELHDLNQSLGKAYDLEPVLTKAVQREGNHQLGGIGTPLAIGAGKAVTGSNWAAAAIGAMKSVIDNPVVKSRLAIALNKSGVPWNAANARIAAYSGALAASSANNAKTDDQDTQSPQ